MEGNISVVLKLRHYTKSEQITSHASSISTHPRKQSAVRAPPDCCAFQQERGERLLCLCCSGSIGSVHGLVFMLVGDGVGQQGSRRLGGGVRIGRENGCLRASRAMVVCVGVEVFPVPFPHGIGRPSWFRRVIQIS